MPVVSVVINAYNHEKYVSEAIQSVLDQTYQDFEIVITDDGSTDGTADFIRQFKDSRIRLYCFERNQGAIVAKNNCLAHVTGKYVAVQSSDDVFLPHRLEKQVRFLDENPQFGAVFSLAGLIDDDGNDFMDTTHPYYGIFNRSNRTRFEWLNYFFYDGNCLCHPSILIRNECFKSIGYQDERYRQLADFDLWVRLCMKYEIHILQEELVKLRIHQTNISGPRPENNIRLHWEYKHILRRYLDIENADDLLRIFPKAEDYRGIAPAFIPFAVAMLALGVDQKAHQDFAPEVLFEQLADKRLAAAIAGRFGFRYADLISLTGRQHDLCDSTAVPHVEPTPIPTRELLREIWRRLL